MGTSELAVVMIRPGTRATAGERPEDAAVDADGNDRHPFRRDSELVRDIASRRL